MLLVGIAFSGFGQDDPAETKRAEKSHQSLKKLPSSILKSLGLSKEDAALSTRGTKLNVYVMGLEQLESFKSGDKAKKLLVNTKETVYPVYVEKKLRTAISIRKGNGGWKNASMGGSEIYTLEPVRVSHSKANNIDAKSYFIVRVPAMYLSFLGYDKGNNFYLIPTHKNPDLNLTIGKSYSAEDVLKKIQPLVEKYRNVIIRRKK